MPAKKAPSSKKKLVSLHVDGATVNPGLVEFLSVVLHAIATRSGNDLERVYAGEPELHVNAAGDLCVYVNNWTV